MIKLTKIILEIKPLPMGMIDAIYWNHYKDIPVKAKFLGVAPNNGDDTATCYFVKFKDQVMIAIKDEDSEGKFYINGDIGPEEIGGVEMVRKAREIGKNFGLEVYGDDNLDEIKSISSSTPGKIINLIDDIRIKIRDDKNLGSYAKIRLRNIMDGEILLQKYHVSSNTNRLAVELESFNKVQLNNLYSDLVDFAKNKLDPHINEIKNMYQDNLGVELFII